MKKVLSLLLSLAMILSVVSVVDFSAYAASDLTTGKCGDNVSYSFDSSTGTLTIRGTGKMYDYGVYNSPFYNDRDIKSVVVKNGIKSIGSYVFLDCRSLTSIIIPNSVTSIGSYAFGNCTSLTSITIPNSVTSIGICAFDCTTIYYTGTKAQWNKIGHINETNGEIHCTDGLIYDGYIVNIDDLKYKIYSYDNCASVSEYNSDITSVIIPKTILYGDKTYTVKSISNGAFWNCKSLTSVTIPDSVTSIGHEAFDNCTSLASITIHDSVTNIGFNAFSNTSYYNNKLNWDRGVLYLGSYLIETDNNILSDNYTIKQGTLTIADNAFCDCQNLISVTIPNSVTSIGSSAFWNCESLTSVTIPDSVTSIGGSTFDTCKSLTSVTIPNTVTSIGHYAFDNCTSLTDVYYNGTKAQWKLISVGDYNTCLTSAVVHCSDSVTFTNKSITQDSIVYVLKDENSAYVSSYNGEPTSVTIFDKITYGGVDVPVTSIGEGALLACKSLTSITIPDSVTIIGDFAFNNCSNLTSVTLSDSVTNICIHSFDLCSKLTDVYYSGTKTQWKSISISSYNGYLINAVIHCSDGGIFSGNRVIIDGLKYQLNNDNTASVIGYTGNPTSVIIPETITYAKETLTVTSISGSAFSGCTSLTNIIISNSVTSIGNFAFQNCASLTTVTIPDNVMSIGISAFSYCYNLKGIIIFNKECSLVNSGLSQKTEILSFHGSQAINYAKSNGNPYSEINCNDYGFEHSYESRILTKPTCTEKGTTRYTCTRCGDYYDEENIEVLGHDYTSKVFKKPTCTEKGTTRYTCTRCGDYYDKKDINALGHDYKSVVLTKPTCTTKGTTRYTCTRCSNYYDEENIESLGGKHSYTSKVIVQPTCEKEGRRQYTCTKCNDIYTETIEPLGHDTKIIERVEPTLTEDGYYHLECQREGCEYSTTHSVPQLMLDFNKNVEKKNSDNLSSYSDTYKIAMEQSGYLVFDFEGESEKWEINIYDEDYKKIGTLAPVFKEFYKKSYLQKRLNSDIPNENQIVALLSGKYYVEINRVSDSTNDNYSGNYKFSIDYQPANETISETKNDFYYDAPTAKDISLNKSYDGFLGATYAATNYAGNDIITQDERDAYKIVIPQGSGLSKLNISLSSKAFAPLGSNCTLYLYNSEFELYEDFKPLTVEPNCMASETVYLNDGVYYIAVTNSNSPIEYSFTTQFNPAGTYICVNHKYELKNMLNPTCETDGFKYYVCKVCGTEYKEILPAIGHTLVNDLAVNPTCISSGLTAGVHCSKCGVVIKEQVVLSKTPHNFANNAQYCLNGCGMANPNYLASTATTKAPTVKKPKSTSIKKVKSAKKAVSVEWKKVSGVKGYEIQLATDKKFKKNKKTVNIKKQKTTKTTVKKLKSKKKYYVRVRTYKTVNGKKVYSSWSKVKSVKTK